MLGAPPFFRGSLSTDFFNFRELALQQLQELNCAPSVPLQDVPRESLRQHLGFGKDDEEARDEIDERLARMISRSFFDLLIIEFRFRTHALPVRTSRRHNYQ